VGKMDIVAGVVVRMRARPAVVLVSRGGTALLVSVWSRLGKPRHRADLPLSALDAAECGIGDKHLPLVRCGEPFHWPAEKLKTQIGQASPELLANLIKAVAQEQRILAQEQRLSFNAAG